MKGRNLQFYVLLLFLVHSSGCDKPDASFDIRLEIVRWAYKGDTVTVDPERVIIIPSNSEEVIDLELGQLEFGIKFNIYKMLTGDSITYVQEIVEYSKENGSWADRRKVDGKFIPGRGDLAKVMFNSRIKSKQNFQIGNESAMIRYRYTVLN